MQETLFERMQETLQNCSNDMFETYVLLGVHSLSEDDAAMIIQKVRRG